MVEHVCMISKNPSKTYNVLNIEIFKSKKSFVGWRKYTRQGEVPSSPVSMLFLLSEMLYEFKQNFDPLYDNHEKIDICQGKLLKLGPNL